MNEELIIPNEETLQALKLHDVMSKEPEVVDVANEEIEKKITTLSKGVSFSIKLTPENVVRLEREATKAGLTDWRQYLREQIAEKILSSAIGSPLINGSSQSKRRVTAPSRGY